MRLSIVVIGCMLLNTEDSILKLVRGFMVIEMAKARIQAAAMTDRVTLVPGDLYKDELPAEVKVRSQTLFMSGFPKGPDQPGGHFFLPDTDPHGIPTGGIHPTG